MYHVMYAPYTATYAHEAVARGAAWLDQQCPDWPTKIDLNELDLQNAYQCVLGQTHTCIPDAKPRPNMEGDESGYWAVLYGTGHELDELWAVEHGFNAPYITHSEYQAGLEMLEIAWIELIHKRLE